ncbi:MAG: tRNA 2-thiouridine(34) synthase MnmA [Candidatus Liptonbacteria bacterium]|nr:tRNA 2-thiouridine(34) synthase MnmA [Candidatus Liptonbacteria bacterium]
MKKYLNKKLKKVFVAMSGGVDSSVAALLLKKQGYDVTGFFMRCYNLDGCAERDAEDARRVAGHLGIPFYVWDFEKEYKERVVEYMIRGYAAGLTPNPDVMCNREIKFGLFLERALNMGADFVATGHYVKIQSSTIKGQKVHKLFQAKDTNKDQSYFLWTLTSKDLEHCLFPIGEYVKPEVRKIAKRARLPTAEKKDSQGICFLGKITLKDFLKQRLSAKRGAIVTSTGVYVGEHDGAAFYTIGQRHGLKLGSVNKELGIVKKMETKPYYVAEKNIRKNTLVVAEGEDNPALYKRTLLLAEVNWIRSIALGRSLSVRARVRYRQPLAAARIMNKESGIRRGSKGLIHTSSFLILKFLRPQKFVAPGQSAVFYSNKGEMLGGGIITCGD